MSDKSLPNQSESDQFSSSPSTTRGKFMLLLVGLIFGILIVCAIRFATYSMDHVHYHANFAVYIDGQREQFKNPQYYEEVKLCNLHGATPQSRAHMHNQVNNVVHVHDAAVTWGQFFENLGWYVGPDFIRSKDKLYTGDAAHKLNIVLNGQDLTDITVITNQVIADNDRLLISYGPSDPAVLKTEYAMVAATAAGYDSQKDPASCSGDEAPTVSDRLKHLL